ncbi:hypothetical protein [Burkholderia ambifaria]|uniref:hypothetical protein n=1 Tax=Burkholderia ambifaria TaxID=152480 RepID=UPI003D15FB88
MTGNDDVSSEKPKRRHADDARPDAVLRGSVNHMLTRDYVERELSHIERMVALLESDADTGAAAMPYAMRVSRPGYWRARIEVLLAIPGMPRHVMKLGNVLLAKIDGIESRRGTRKP